MDKNSWIEVDYSSWAHPTVDKDKFEKLKNAIVLAKRSAQRKRNVGKVYLLKNYDFSEKKRGEDLASSSPLLNGCDDCCFCGRF